MAGLIDYIVENLEVDQLTLAEADEALFYIDLHLDQPTEMQEVIKLFDLKSKILQRITQLEEMKIDSD